MHRLRFPYLFITAIFGLAFSAVASAETNLTPDQLALLMKASRERYRSFDAKIKATDYRYDDEMTSRQLIGVEQITWRWSKERNKSFLRRAWNPTIADARLMKKGIRTSALTPQWTKKLTEYPDSNRPPRGQILVRKTPRTRKVSEFLDPYEALWSIFGWSWDKVDFSSVSREKNTNYYVLNCYLASKGPKGAKVTLYIDPSKNFVPVKREICKSDGTVVIKERCELLTQAADGLYVPSLYYSFWANYNEEYVFEVQNVVVNETIPDNLLDFEFPEGTIVRDDRIGSTYTIGKASTGQSTVVDPCSQSGQSGAVTVTAAATDDQLRAAAVKAKELLEAHSATEKPSPVIEVSPTVVLVTADKSEYKLSIKKYDGTKPVLLNYEFESSELELSSFKNLINTEDQVIANINRVQSHTGFASGTLLLQYAGEDRSTKVTFVSAPLPNAP